MARAHGPGWLRSWAGPLAVLVVFALCGLAIAELGIPGAKLYFGEDGPVEIATPIVLVLTAILYAVWMAWLGLTSFVPPLVLTLMTWRELDGDLWFTGKSVISSGYYFDNPGVAFGERAFVGAIVAVIGLTILHSFWRARFRILTALRQMQPYCRSLLLAVPMLAASLTLDGLGRKVYAAFGVRLATDPSMLAGMAEEVAELGLAVAFLVALLQLRFDAGSNVLPGARSRVG